MRRLNRLRSVAELLAEDGTGFGYTITLSGDSQTALIGANENETFVFAKGADGNWSQQSKLTAYGYSVSLSADGSTVVIGGAGSACTSAYVFAKGADGSLSQQAELTYNETSIVDLFGWSVSLSADGQTALIGAPWNDDVGEWSGAAFVFTKGPDGSWSQQAKFIADDSTENDCFGWSVSLAADGQTALIGAWHKDNYLGSAYVFNRGTDNTWHQQAKLLANEGSGGDAFGCSVSLSADGQTALVGTSSEINQAVYVFIKGVDSSWRQQAKLTAENGAAGDLFGRPASMSADEAMSLSADGQTALIGSYGDDDKGKNSGAAYVFVKETDGSWSQRLKLMAEDGAAGDWFGSSVALSADGRTAMIGAPGDDDRSTDSGSVYVFSIPPANVSAPVSVMRLRR